MNYYVNVKFKMKRHSPADQILPMSACMLHNFHVYNIYHMYVTYYLPFNTRNISDFHELRYSLCKHPSHCTLIWLYARPLQWKQSIYILVYNCLSGCAYCTKDNSCICFIQLLSYKKLIYNMLTYYVYAVVDWLAWITWLPGRLYWWWIYAAIEWMSLYIVYRALLLIKENHYSSFCQGSFLLFSFYLLKCLMSFLRVLFLSYYLIQL